MMRPVMAMPPGQMCAVGPNGQMMMANQVQIANPQQLQGLFLQIRCCQRLHPVGNIFALLRKACTNKFCIRLCIWKHENRRWRIFFYYWKNQILKHLFWPKNTFLCEILGFIQNWYNSFVYLPPANPHRCILKQCTECPVKTNIMFLAHNFLFSSARKTFLISFVRERFNTWLNF